MLSACEWHLQEKAAILCVSLMPVQGINKQGYLKNERKKKRCCLASWNVCAGWLIISHSQLVLKLLVCWSISRYQINKDVCFLVSGFLNFRTCTFPFQTAVDTLTKIIIINHLQNHSVGTVTKMVNLLRHSTQISFVSALCNLRECAESQCVNLFLITSQPVLTEV